MYDYKSIGNTAAKVVSVLAVAGGLLWWQRGATYYPVPHPQDEAELMAACIERTMAITANTNFCFTKTYTATVSKTITGTNYLSLQIASSIQSNGMNWAYGPDQVVYSWPIGKAASLDNVGDNSYQGMLGILTVYYYGANDLSGNVFVLLSSSDYSAEWDNYGEYYTPNPLPAILSDGGSGCAPPLLTASSVSGTKSNFTFALLVYSYVTNAAAHTDTNTIGMFPNATYQYPTTIRNALSPSGGRYWVLPPSFYMTTGNDPGYLTNFPTTHLDSAPNWWTNYVTAAQGTFLTTINYSLTNAVYTNYPPATNWVWQTNILWHSQLLINPTTADVDGGKLFAFERDQTPLYWSTNAYNDLARPLSLMQWQSSSVQIVTVSSNIQYVWTPSNNVLPLSFDWNDTTSSGAAGAYITGKNPVQPYNVVQFVNPIPVNPNFAVCAAPSYTFTLLCDYGYNYVYNLGGGQGGNGMANVTFTFINSYATITNPTPFIWTNISLYVTNIGFTAQGTVNNEWATNLFKPWSYPNRDGILQYWDFSYTFGWWTNQTPISDFANSIINNRQIVFTTNACILPGASMTFSFSGFNFLEQYANISNQVATYFGCVATYVNALGAQQNPSQVVEFYFSPHGPSGEYSEIPNNLVPSSAPLPFVLGGISLNDSYRVQFQALTNYLNHTPIR